MNRKQRLKANRDKQKGATARVDRSGLPWREVELIALAKKRGLYREGMIRAELMAALS